MRRFCAAELPCGLILPVPCQSQGYGADRDRIALPCDRVELIRVLYRGTISFYGRMVVFSCEICVFVVDLCGWGKGVVR